MRSAYLTFMILLLFLYFSNCEEVSVCVQVDGEGFSGSGSGGVGSWAVLGDLPLKSGGPPTEDPKTKSSDPVRDSEV